MERRRWQLFERLFLLFQDDQYEYDEFIERAQFGPAKLRDQCITSRDTASWTLNIPKKTYESRIKEHKEACLRHIAFQDLIIRDLRGIQASDGRKLHDTVILPVGRYDQGLPWLVNSLTQAHEHLVAVYLLIGRDQHLASRRAGGTGKSRKLYDKDYEAVIRALVKSLLLNEQYRQHALSKADMEKRFLRRIMELWKNHPFFRFEKGKIEDSIGQVLAELDVAAMVKKSPYERRSRSGSIKRLDRVSRSTEPEAIACEHWQKGLGSALEVILEHSFGTLSETDRGRIAEASPSQLQVWLCRARNSPSVEDVLQ